MYFIAFILFNFPLLSAPIEVKKRFSTSPCVYDGLHQESLIGLQVHFLLVQSPTLTYMLLSAHALFCPLSECVALAQKLRLFCLINNNYIKKTKNFCIL